MVFVPPTTFSLLFPPPPLTLFSLIGSCVEVRNEKDLMKRQENDQDPRITLSKYS